MKTQMLVICSLLILVSCTSKKNNSQFNENKKFEIMKGDPVVTEFLKNAEAVAKLTTESESLDFNKYLKILKKYKVNNICNVSKGTFNEDVEMRKLADLSCQMKLTKKALLNKYPMTKEEISEFVRKLNINFNYDMNARKKKAREKYERKNLEN